MADSPTKTDAQPADAEMPEPVSQLGTPETDDTLDEAIAKAEEANGYETDEDDEAMPEGHPEAAEGDADDTPDGEAEETDESEDADAEAATEGEPGDGDDQEETDEYDQAVAALMRDGWSLRDLKNLAAARVIELGAKAAKRQADIDAKLRGQSETRETGTDGDTADGDADLALPESLTEALDDEAAGDLSSYIGKAIERATKPLIESLEQRDRIINTHKKALDALHFESARAALIKEGHNELSSDATWKAVMEGVSKLDQSKFTSYKDLIKAAAHGAAGDTARSRRTEQYNKRDRGQPTPPGKKPGAPRKLTPAQREDERLRELEEQHGVSAA